MILVFLLVYRKRRKKPEIISEDEPSKSRAKSKPKIIKSDLDDEKIDDYDEADLDLEEPKRSRPRKPSKPRIVGAPKIVSSSVDDEKDDESDKS